MCRMTSSTQLPSSWDVYRLVDRLCGLPLHASILEGPRRWQLWLWDPPQEEHFMSWDGDFWRPLAITQPLVQLSERASGRFCMVCDRVRPGSSQWQRKAAVGPGATVIQNTVLFWAEGELTPLLKRKMIPGVELSPGKTWTEFCTRELWRFLIYSDVLGPTVWLSSAFWISSWVSCVPAHAWFG